MRRQDADSLIETSADDGRQDADRRRNTKSPASTCVLAGADVTDQPFSFVADRRCHSRTFQQPSENTSGGVIVSAARVIFWSYVQLLLFLQSHPFPSYQQEPCYQKQRRCLAYRDD